MARRSLPRTRRVRILPAVVLRWTCSGCNTSNGADASSCQGCGAAW
ncbi:hypothetical protein [Streptomyces sp. NPDC058595]